MLKLTILKRPFPTFLMGLGIAGMIAAVVLTAHGTVKAEARKREAETVSTAWTCYIPAAVTCVLSASCLIGSGSVYLRRIVANAAAYSLTKSAFREYREKVVEAAGKGRERAIRDSVAAEWIRRNPVDRQRVIRTGKGSTLCYDAVSGRYFQADIEKIRKTEAAFNQKLFYRDRYYIPLNEFYREIGLEGVSAGEDLGWGIRGNLMDFSSQLTADGTPCLVLDCHVVPQYKYT